ncbi:MAG: PAS domain-containing protein, partial [Coleofasciculaceae cyanobacterium]
MNTSFHSTQNLPPSDCNCEAEKLRLLRQRLKTTEARNRQLLASLPQIVWFAQVNGEVTEFNPRWYEYTGLTALKSLGWEFLKALHPEDQDRFVALYNLAAQMPQPYEFECRILGTDHDYQWFWAQVTPITAADGQICEWMGTYTLLNPKNFNPGLSNDNHSLRELNTPSKSTATTPQNIEKQRSVRTPAKNTDELAKERLRNLTKELAQTIVWEASATTAEYTFVSQNAEKVLGYPVEKWLTEPDFWVNLIHPEDRQWTVALSHKAIKYSRDYELEYRCLTADQRVVWLRDRAFVIRDEHGNVYKRRGMMVDITLAKLAQAELHVQKRQQTAIVQLGQKAVSGSISALMEESVALVSQALAVEYCQVLEYQPHEQNLHLRAGVGWQEGEVGQATIEASPHTHAGYTLYCGQPIVFQDLRRERRFRGSELLHDHGVVSGMSVVIEAKPDPTSTQPLKRPFGILGAHSSKRRKFSRSDIDFLQAVAYVLGTAITEQQSDQALAEARRKLAQTQAALEKRNQEFEQFTYITSHDLRAPLRAIANLSQWIEEDLGEQLDQENQYQMQLLRGRVFRLEAMFEGLLEYSRAGRVKTQPEWVDVGALLQEIIETAPPTDLTIEIASTMPRLYTNRCQLQQVFSHLIKNAILHLPSSTGVVKISTKQKLDGYQFTVSDNGEGIAPQFQERVFQIFQTLQARDTVENVGMGLAIVKKIVESQGGTICLDSQTGR